MAAKKKPARSRWESTSQEDRRRPLFSTTLDRATIATIDALAEAYGLRRSTVVELAIALLDKHRAPLDLIASVAKKRA